MERVFPLTADLPCMWEEEDLPEGTLAVEPRCLGGDWIGTDLVFLASRDGRKTWREYRTIMEIEDVGDWFELVEPVGPCGD